MDDRKISITIWGKEKGDWIEWYNDIKNLMNKLGYEHTHIGILSKNYSSGKIFTVARKEREILTKINEGEIPMSLSCYSLPNLKWLHLIIIFFVNVMVHICLLY